MGHGASKKVVSEEEKYNLDTTDDSLDKNSYPMNNVGLTLTLNDSRKLGYMIYGATSNFLSTIILFPGSPGTRLFNFESHDAINKAFGIRMIVVDRPGIGLSSPHKDYTFKSHAQDVHQLIESLNLKTYHVVGYSAGGPSACVFAALYSNDDSDCKLKSVTVISGVGPPEAPNVYGQMGWINKVGWFIVSNGSQKLITFSANIDSKSSAKKPIESLVQDFSRYSEYDKEMIKHPVILKTFLRCKYEEEATDVETGDIDKSDNRLLCLYGTPWGIDWSDIQCPFYVYNGTDDTGCVPNMALFIFESVTGKKEPKMDAVKKDDDERKENDDEQNASHGQMDEDNINAKTKAVGSVEVDAKEDIDDEDDIGDEVKEEPVSFLKVDDQIMQSLQAEYEENETMNVKNKQSKLVWGSGKGHLWFFEQDLWRDIIYRVKFLEQKK